MSDILSFVREIIFLLEESRNLEKLISVAIMFSVISSMNRKLGDKMYCELSAVTEDICGCQTLFIMAMLLIRLFPLYR